MMSNRDANLAAIKEGLYSISRQLTSAPKARPSNDIKALASKLHDLVLKGNSSVERFYFIYLLCQICNSEKPNKVDKLMKLIFVPNQQTLQSTALISDIVCFALCHPSHYSNVLDNLSSYAINLDTHIQVESWHQAESLASDSPSVCSSLLSRADLPQLKIDKRLLAKWLQDLSKIDQNFPSVNLTHIIKYSLFDSRICDHIESGATTCSIKRLSSVDLLDSELHFGILTLIQSKRCQTLTNQFLVDIVTNICQRLDGQSDKSANEQISTNQLVDRFAQILSVSAASKVASITNTLRTSLAKLESNQIIKALIKWQNK